MPTPQSPEPVVPQIDAHTPNLGDELLQQDILDRQQKRNHEDIIQSQQVAFPTNPVINNSMIGNYKDGPLPGAKTNTAMEFAKNAAQYLSQADQWANNNYNYGKTFSYGAGYRNLNFDRYYSHSGFKKLGFSPFRDNEKVYNDNTSASADFGRMASGWLGMAGLGAKDLYSEWFDHSLNADQVHSEEMTKRMSNMTSSRSGAMGWITNFGANTAYTAGIIGEIAAEELALVGLTALTEGAAAPLLVGRTLKNVATLPQKLWEGFRSINKVGEALKGINTAEKARELFKLANVGEAARWANPLSRTAEFAGTVNSLKNLTEYATMAKGAGSLYRDIREINAVTSESKLEGGMTQTDLNDKLINDYYTKNGVLPEGDVAKSIYEKSKAAGFATTLANIPLIYFSNKIVFKNALKGFKSVEPFLESEAKGILADKVLVKDALGASKFVSKYSIPGVKNIFKPGNLMGGSLRYTLANLTEGIQESSQDVISAAYKNYYEDLYKDPNMASIKASFSVGAASQATGQGLDTFLSGFLMGGVLQGPQKLVFEGAPQLAKKIFDPKGYQTYQNQKTEYINTVTNAINDVNKNPAQYVKAISNIDKNFVLQKKTNSIIETAVEDNDQKAFQDAKDESSFNHIYTLLKSGQTNTLTDQIKALKELKPEELAEAFGEPVSTSLYQKLDSFTEKVDYLKDRYEVMEKKMVNPFDPSKKTGSEQLDEYYAKESFDDLKKMALFSRYTFDRTLERMQSVTQDAIRNKPLSKASSHDFTLLFSPTDIQNEINILKGEIQTYENSTSSSDKQLAKKKQVKLDTLREFKSDLKGLTILLKDRKTSSNDPEASDSVIAEQTKLLHNSYTKYIKSISGITGDHVLDENVNNAFRSLKDFHELQAESINLANAVNFLTNPESFREVLKRSVEERKAVEKNSIEYFKEGVVKSISNAEVNALLNKLHDMGVFIAPEDVDALIEHNKIPTRFYDITKGGSIIPGSDKAKEIASVIEIFKQATTPLSPETIPTPGAQPVTVVTPTVVPAVDNTKLSATSSIEELLNHPILSNALVEAYKIENDKRAPIEKEKLDGLTPEKIIKGSSFQSFIQIYGRIVDPIFNTYNTSTGRTINKPKSVTPVSVIAHVPEVITDEKELLDLTKGIVSQERMNSIAEKISKNEKLSEGETQAYKIKFKDIDVIVDTLIPKVIVPEFVPEEIPPTVMPTETPQVRIDKVTSVKELNLLEGQFVEELATPAIRKAFGLSNDLLSKLINTKLRELKRTVTFDDIYVNEVLKMKDKVKFGESGMVYVVKKTPKQLKVTKVGDESGNVITIHADNVVQEIELRDTEGLTAEDIIPVPTDLETSLTNNSINNISDAAGKPEIIDTFKNVTSKGNIDDFDPTC